jgi:hypothetical protein
MDTPSNRLAALAAAEQAALEHVGHLRARGATLAEVAEGIGLDPANCRTWDDVTMAYAGRAYDMARREV